MTGEVLILGGAGNFGKRIAAALTRHNVRIIVAGRNRDKVERVLAALPPVLADSAIFDIHRDLTARLEALHPAVVVNTCGPFQTGSYDAARCCIARNVHYVDLADGRDFVAGIGALDADAKAHGVAVVSGASTVPGLSSAVIENFRHEFSVIESLRFGISPGQRAERGLATTQGIMTYVGRPLKPVAGSARPVYGWQGVHRQDYPELGKRWMANCDIPDLDLLPARYGIRSIRFTAGLELGTLHLGLWLLSWLVRLGVPLDLPRHAALLLKASNWFDGFGTSDGGMHMILRGWDAVGKPHERRWFLVAKNGDGPQIPCVPAIILARKLARGERLGSGAYPCVGLVSLEEYLDELRAFNIRQYVVP